MTNRRQGAVYVYEPFVAGCLLVIVIIVILIVIARISQNQNPPPSAQQSQQPLPYSITLSDEFRQDEGPARSIDRVGIGQCSRGGYKYPENSVEVSFTYGRSSTLPLPEATVRQISDDITSQLRPSERGEMSGNRAAFSRTISLDCEHDFVCHTSTKVRLGKLTFTDSDGTQQEADFSVPVEIKAECVVK